MDRKIKPRRPKKGPEVRPRQVFRANSFSFATARSDTLSGRRPSGSLSARSESTSPKRSPNSRSKSIDDRENAVPRLPLGSLSVNKGPPPLAPKASFSIKLKEQEENQTQRRKLTEYEQQIKDLEKRLTECSQVECTTDNPCHLVQSERERSALLAKQVEGLKRELTATKNSLAQLEQELTKATTQYEEIKQKQQKEVQHSAAEQTNKDHEVQQLKAKVIVLEKDIQGLEAVQRAGQSTIANLTKELAATKGKLEEWREKAESKKHAEKTEAMRANKFQRDLTAAKTELQKALKTEEALKADIGAANEETKRAWNCARAFRLKLKVLLGRLKAGAASGSLSFAEYEEGLEEENFSQEDDDAATKLIAAENKIQQLQAENEQLLGAAQENHGQQQTIASLKLKADTAESQVTRLQEQLKVANKEAEEGKASRDSLAEELKREKQSKKTLQSSEIALKKEIQQLQAEGEKVKELRDSVAQWEAKAANAEKQLSTAQQQWSKERKQLQDDLAAQQAEVQSLKTANHQHQLAQAELQSRLHTVMKEHDNAESSASAMDRLLKETKQELTASQAEVAKLRLQAAAAEEAKQQLKVAQEEAASAEKKLQAAQASKLSCWEQMDKLRLDVASLDKANGAALKAAQQQLQEDNSSLKAQLKALQELADQQKGAMEVQSKAAAEELEKVKEELRRTKEQLKSAKSDAALTEARLQDELRELRVQQIAKGATTSELEGKVAEGEANLKAMRTKLKRAEQQAKDARKEATAMKKERDEAKEEVAKAQEATKAKKATIERLKRAEGVWKREKEGLENKCSELEGALARCRAQQEAVVSKQDTLLEKKSREEKRLKEELAQLKAAAAAEKSRLAKELEEATARMKQALDKPAAAQLPPEAKQQFMELLKCYDEESRAQGAVGNISGLIKAAYITDLKKRLERTTAELKLNAEVIAVYKYHASAADKALTEYSKEVAKKHLKARQDQLDKAQQKAKEALESGEAFQSSSETNLKRLQEIKPRTEEKLKNAKASRKKVEDAVKRFFS